MTVGELIEKLRDMDQDAPVVKNCEASSWDYSQDVKTVVYEYEQAVIT